MKGEKLVEMGLLQKAGVRAFTDNQHVISDTKQMRNIMSYSKSLDTLLMLHPQDASLSANSCATSGFFATELGLPQVSTKAEVIAVSRDLNLAAMTGAKIHFSNISTKESLDLIRQAKNDSIKVTCDTSPPYFCLNEKAIGNFRTYAKFTPPLRQENDRIAVLEALHDKTIDVVTSSHTPCDTDDKRLPFAHARAGGTGLVTLLGTTLQSGLSLIETIRLLTYNPAQLMNLKIGSLTPGYKADLCLFDPERTWTVRAGKLPGLAQNTPFDDWDIKGYILKTIHHGLDVYNAPL